jgi:hypothetical protein
MKRTKIKRSYVQFTKIVKISPPCSMHRQPHKIQGIQIVIVFTFLYVLIVLCLFLIVESALKVCRSNSDTPCIPWCLPEVLHINGTDFVAQVAQTCCRPVILTQATKTPLIT